MENWMKLVRTMKPETPTPPLYSYLQPSTFSINLTTNPLQKSQYCPSFLLTNPLKKSKLFTSSSQMKRKIRSESEF